jgi:hypothetical protein
MRGAWVGELLLLILMSITISLKKQQLIWVTGLIICNAAAMHCFFIVPPPSRQHALSSCG